MLIKKLAPIVTATLLLTGTKASAVGWEHYDRNPDFEPQVLPSGAVANFDDWKRVMPYSRVGPGIEVAPRLVTDNVWMFDGAQMFNATIDDAFTESNNVITEVDPMGALMEEKGVISVYKIGEAKVCLMQSNEVYEFTAREMRRDPKLLYQVEK